VRLETTNRTQQKRAHNAKINQLLITLDVSTRSFFNAAPDKKLKNISPRTTSAFPFVSRVLIFGRFPLPPTQFEQCQETYKGDLKNETGENSIFIALIFNTINK
jgi:hypothetical protein